jgi:CrcB protein
MTNILVPALCAGTGGFLGTLLRYGASVVARSLGIAWPAGTLVSNLAGCLLIGLIAAWVDRAVSLSPEARVFLATGVCGGFTTMSSFVYETAQFVRDGEIAPALTYAGVTLVGSFLLFGVGLCLGGAFHR